MSPEFEKNKSQDFSVSHASDLSEADLCGGLKNGVNDAYCCLIENYADKLYRLAFRFLKKQEDAEEAVQETFQKVVENIRRFEGKASLYTWIYRICVNQCLMRTRSQDAKPALSWEEHAPKYERGVWVGAVSDWEKLPDQMFLEKEFQNFVRDCIESLPEDLKTSYILKDVEECDEKQVCEILDITKSTMRNRVHRARLLLRERLEKKYVR